MKINTLFFILACVIGTNALPTTAIETLTTTTNAKPTMTSITKTSTVTTTARATPITGSTILSKNIIESIIEKGIIDIGELTPPDLPINDDGIKIGDKDWPTGNKVSDNVHILDNHCIYKPLENKWFIGQFDENKNLVKTQYSGKFNLDDLNHLALCKANTGKLQTLKNTQNYEEFKQVDAKKYMSLIFSQQAKNYVFTFKPGTKNTIAIGYFTIEQFKTGVGNSYDKYENCIPNAAFFNTIDPSKPSPFYVTKDGTMYGIVHKDALRYMNNKMLGNIDILGNFAGQELLPEIKCINAKGFTTYVGKWNPENYVNHKNEQSITLANMLGILPSS